MWTGCWNVWLADWLGEEWRGDNKARVFTESCRLVWERKRERESRSRRAGERAWAHPSGWADRCSAPGAGSTPGCREDHTKEGASLVGGHQRESFSLSGFQERAQFSLFLLTLFLMLYSRSCPPWTSVYCRLQLAPLNKTSWGFPINSHTGYRPLCTTHRVSFLFLFEPWLSSR